MITDFRGEHYFLSNFYPVEVIYGGEKYASAEHAFQAAKCVNDVDRKRIRDAESPCIAKKIGRTVQLIDDWEMNKQNEMAKILHVKFQNSVMRDLLIKTKVENIVERNYWHDIYWGMCACYRHHYTGKNVLGELLMCVRDNIFLEIRHLEPNIFGDIINEHRTNRSIYYGYIEESERALNIRKPRVYDKLWVCSICSDKDDNTGVFEEYESERIANHIYSHSSGPRMLSFEKNVDSHRKYHSKLMFRCDTCNSKYDLKSEIVEHCCVGEMCLECGFNPCICKMFFERNVTADKCGCYYGGRVRNCKRCTEMNDPDR